MLEWVAAKMIGGAVVLILQCKPIVKLRARVPYKIVKVVS